MKRKVLSLLEKCEILKSLDSGSSVTYLSKKYGIAKSTVCAIKNKKRDILKVTSRRSEIRKRKTLKSCKMPRMEKKLYSWFCTQRLKNVPVSIELLKTKAKAINETIAENPNFNASDGWSQRFKRRFGIRHLKISGEKLSAAPEHVGPFKNYLRKKIEELQLTHDQLYNADETGLFWKLLPERTLVTSEERSAPGRKTDKSRVTLLACTNATGEHKIKPLVIGRAANPRCFKNFSLPVQYTSTKNAWMTSGVFENWFHHSFVPQVRRFLKQKGLPQKALLLLDNAPSHPPAENLVSDDGKILTVYMPPNVTALIQPMDQNVIRLTKLFYRRSLLSTIVASDSNDISAVIKNLSLKDAVTHLTLAWMNVKEEIIAKCWKNILSDSFNSDSDSEEDVPLAILQEKYKNSVEAVTFQETVALLQKVNGNITYSRKDIENWNTDVIEDLEEDVIEIESAEETMDDEPMPTTIPTQEALQGLNIVISWAEQNMLNSEDLLTLRRIKEIAVQRCLKEKKVQTKLTSFFNKQN